MAREIKRKSDVGGEDSQSSTKRARYSNGNLTQYTRELDLDQDVEDDDDDDDDLSDEDYGDMVWNAATGYDDSRFDDVRLASIYDKSQARRSLGKALANKYDENAGWIKQIHLVDFMCHENLSVTLGKNLNFLVGHNGSGKSALLTALSIAMGGKAALTNRASTLTGLIRGQQPRAIITVVLHNKGYNSYNHALYGDSIYIERTITRSSNSWKIRASRNGEVLSKTKAELDSIRTAFLIDCDQPLTILTQDMARSFLAQSDPRMLYKFFNKGTNLEELKSLLDRARDNIEMAGANAAMQDTVRKALAAEIKDLEKIVQRHTLVMTQREQLEQLKNQRCWAEIQDKESAMKEDAAKTQAVEETITEKQTELTAKEAAAADLKADVARVEAEMATKKQATRALGERMRNGKKAFDSAKEAYEDCLQHIESIEASIKDCDSDIANLVAKIESQRAASGQAESPEVQQLRTSIEKYETVLLKVKEARFQSESGMAQAEAEQAEAVEAKRQAERNKLDANQAVDKAQSDVERAEQLGRNRLTVFGSNVDCLIRDIEKESWCGTMPIGPVGRHVKLNSSDRETQQLFTALLGPLMCGFIVTDMRDRSKLLRLIERHNRQGYSAAVGQPIRPGRGAPKMPSIIRNSGDMFDYSSGDRARYGNGRMQTLMSALTIDNELVRRVMIISSRIEREFFMQDRTQANRDLKEVLVPALRQVTVHCTDGTTLRADGDFRQATPWRCEQSVFITDTASETTQALQRLEDAKQQQRTAHEAFQAAVENARSSEAKLVALKTEIAKRVSTVRQVEAKIEDLRTRLPDNSSMELDANEALLTNHRHSLATLRASLETSQADRTRLENAKIEAKQAYRVLEAERANADPDRAQNEELLTRMGIRHQRSQLEINKYRETLDGMRRDLGAREANRVAEQNRLKELIKKAEAAGDRIQVKASLKKLDAEIAKLESALRKSQASRDANELDNAQDKLERAKSKIEKIDRDLDAYFRFAAIVEKALDDRDEHWQRLRSEATLTARVVFLKCMGKRGFAGRIAIRHDAKELTMGVIAASADQQENAAPTQYKSASLLSGGERSFATVSLLLALWESAGGPLRCLDEWDVFLDQVNRDLAAEMLIDGAKSSVGKQYILITPQNMSGVKIDDGHSKIIRLKDPKRNQGTLSFGST